MPVTFNKRCLCSVIFVVVILIFVLQYFFQLFYDQKFVFVAPLVTGKGANDISRSKQVVSYRLLCAFDGKDGNSICDEPDDEKLAQIISKVFLDRPTYQPYSFQLNPPKLVGQIGVPPIVDKLLGEKRNGFFIESGAYDGEEHSNSLYFEIKRNFSGLLVEPNFFNYQKLLGKNRRATSINACYAITPLPTMVDFVNAKAVSGIQDIKVGSWMRNERVNVGQSQSKALCLPFYSILLAMGNPTVDYFSLDVEGAELPILKTIPWDKVNIKILSIEVNHSDGKKIDTFMKSKGYKLVQQIPSSSEPQDNIYSKI